MNGYKGLLVLIVLGSLGACGYEEAMEEGERSGLANSALTRQGRWFRYGGKPVYMVGVDMQSVAAQKPNSERGWDGNYTRVLDALKAARINKVRLWANNWFLPANLVHQPFARLASGRYDLDQWSASYWSRLRDFVNKARARGIFVEYNLFSIYPNTKYWDNEANFWAAANNVNGIVTVGGSDGPYPEFFTNAGGQKSTSGHDLTYYQRRLIAKAVSELRSFGNVYFKVINEPDDGRFRQIFPWSRSLAQYIHDNQGMLSSVDSKAHGDMTTLVEYSSRSYVDIIGSNSYTDDPATVASRLHRYQRSNKVLQCSESFDHRTELAKTTREAWGWATAGGHYAFYGRDRDFGLVGDATWAKTARVARTLRDTMESFNFSKMSPVDGGGAELERLVRQGPGDRWQVLAEVGSQYLVYFWGQSSTTGARIDLPSNARYDYRWIDVRDGDVLGTGSVDGQSGALIKAPGTGGWSGSFGLALTLKATTTTTTPPAPAPPPPPAPAPSSSVSLPTIADTFVINGLDNSFGSSSTISVNRQPRYGYLKFDLRQLSGTVKRARLKLWVLGSGSGTNTFRMHRVSGDGWGESMSWDTRPAVDRVVGNSFVAERETWVTVDLTDAVADEQQGDGVLSLRIESLAGYAGFASKEAASSLRPELFIELDDAPAPPPPPPAPSSTTLQSSADTFVINGLDKSFGSSSTISVNRQPRYGYLKFDLRQLSGTVKRARLELWALGSGSGVNTFRMHRVSGDGWGEAMTWATRPAADRVVVDSFDARKETWVSLDLTQAVADELQGDGVLSLRIESLAGYAGFASREASSSYRPRLEISVQ